MMFNRRFVYIIILILILFGIICLFPYWFTSKATSERLDFTTTGQIGDTIGGITGPFIAMVAAILTFLAFWIQYVANKEQFKQFNKQDDEKKIDRFEARFYELLRIHIENVRDLEAVRYHDTNQSISGKKLFISLYDELKFIFFALKKIERDLLEDDEILEGYGDDELIKIAYIIFFVGVGNKSGALINSLLINRPKKLIGNTMLFLSNRKSDFKSGKKVKVELSDIVLNEESEITKELELNIKYLPFAGHMSRLGHYFRHLFQTVKFVVDQNDNLISNKYEYLKTLRAQLSNHEQLLLYYNSVSPLGRPWIKNDYLTEYMMIKNIPLPLADFGISPKDLLGEKNKKGDFLFEWDEIIERFSSY